MSDLAAEELFSKNIITGNDAINSIIKKCSDASLIDTNLISDGHHTFGSLYEHRIELFITLARIIAREGNAASPWVWRTKRYSDGNEIEAGWFLLGIGERAGDQITYHLPIDKWEQCDFANYENNAPEFDGHSDRDVLERLKEL